MNFATYEVEAKVESTHWWFVGRRKLFAILIAGLDFPKDCPVLDIGTSTGTNLRMLRDIGFTKVLGLDLRDEAIEWCAAKGLGAVLKGDVCSMPIGNGEYQLVLATDVIEHVDDDVSALREIYRVLKSGGYALVTVPTFQSLWGLQDDVGQHKRRYTRKELIEKLDRAGFVVDRCFYFNYLLFVPIWLARRVIRIINLKIKSEGELNSPTINFFLKSIFLCDVATAEFIKPNFGVSALALVRKL